MSHYTNDTTTTTDAPTATKRHGSRIHPGLFDATAEAGSSPAVKALGALVNNWNLERIEALAAQGKRAIWGGMFWDSPLFRATDTIAISITELWRRDSKEAERIAEDHFQIPSEFCSMIKTMSGRWHLKRNTIINRILIFGSTCEPASMLEQHARRDGYEIHTVEGATAFKINERRDELVKFFANELRKATIWLQGKPVDEDRLAEEIRLKNQAIRKVARIMDLRLKRPRDLGSLPMMWLIFGTSSYYGDPAQYNALLDQILHDLEQAAQTPDPRPYLPLILAGQPPGGLSFFELLENAGAVLVGLVILGTALYREDVPPLESLAHYLFESQLRGELGEATGASALLRRRRIEELIEKTGARGLVSSAVTACPYASLVQQIERNYFRKQGFPIVALEHSVHNEPITEEQTMKIKAFLEQLSETDL